MIFSKNLIYFIIGNPTVYLIEGFTKLSKNPKHKTKCLLA